MKSSTTDIFAGMGVGLLVLLLGIGGYSIGTKAELWAEHVETLENTKTVYTGVNYYSLEQSEQCKNVPLETMVRGTVTGMSMQPGIDHNSILLETPYNSSIKLVEGDVIVTARFAHRVIGVYKDYVLTKGDNNAAVDAVTNYSDIEYVVCGVLK